MSAIDVVCGQLVAEPRRWLVTGAAGFIGSHLVEKLLRLGQQVVGLDNYATGDKRNVDDVLASVGAAAAERFRMIEGDIREPGTCRAACAGAERILHQAGLGSVPRSLADPRTTHDVNVTGFLNVLLAARDAKVGRVVYASSSSVYGDHPKLPKQEDHVGRQLSPYAVSKYADELYAYTFGMAYGLELVGLRYFNVFGPRQDPNGPYAAVIPRWFAALLRGGKVVIHGDGETSRDFCFVENVVQANILAALATGPDAVGSVYNIACGGRTTLNELFGLIREQAARSRPEASAVEPEHTDFRPGDVRHSQADVERAMTRLGYEPTHQVREGLAQSAAWYARAFGESVQPR